jgi:signal transduction histidine kinase
VRGEPGPLPGGAALAAYRIIQESLTNVRKHAGAWARAEVLLTYSGDALEVSVTDDGLGVSAPCDGAGHGLTGMRERAAMYGGSVQAGPAPDGGFRVTARLPVALASGVLPAAPPAPTVTHAGAASAGAPQAGAA